MNIKERQNKDSTTITNALEQFVSAYTYRSSVNDNETFTNKTSKKLKEGEIDKFKPQYLWEDLFGNASIFENGLFIV